MSVWERRSCLQDSGTSSLVQDSADPSEVFVLTKPKAQKVKRQEEADTTSVRLESSAKQRRGIDGRVNSLYVLECSHKPSGPWRPPVTQT